MIVSRAPPFRHASTNQNRVTPKPICGFTATKKRPIWGGRIKPSIGRHSIFELLRQWITGGDKRKAASVPFFAPNLIAMKENVIRPRVKIAARPMCSVRRANGISGMTVHGAAKKMSTVYGDFPWSIASAAGR